MASPTILCASIAPPRRDTGTLTRLDLQRDSDSAPLRPDDELVGARPGDHATAIDRDRVPVRVVQPPDPDLRRHTSPKRPTGDRAGVVGEAELAAAGVEPEAARQSGHRLRVRLVEDIEHVSR